MHVVLVLDHAHINGGQAKVAIDSALGLRARGHDVTLFAAVGPIDPRLPEAGVEVICLGQPDVDTARSNLAFAAQVIWNGAAAQALGERIARCDPARTLVHVHGWAKALSSAIGPAIARSGLPAVYTMHEFFLVCPKGGFYDYPRAEICHRRSMSAACVGHNCDSRNYPRKLLRVARHAALDHVSRMRDTIRHVVLISDLQREVSARYFPSTAVFHRVDNPISVPDLGRKPGPGDTFLYVGRLSPEKGVEIFAEAAKLAGAAGDRRRWPERGGHPGALPGSAAPGLAEPRGGPHAYARGAGAGIPVRLVRGTAAHRVRGAGGRHAGGRQRHLRRALGGRGRGERVVVPLRRRGVPGREADDAVRRWRRGWDERGGLRPLLVGSADPRPTPPPLAGGVRCGAPGRACAPRGHVRARGSSVTDEGE